MLNHFTEINFADQRSSTGTPILVEAGIYMYTCSCSYMYMYAMLCCSLPYLGSVNFACTELFSAFAGAQ